jgi:membrane-associated protease RseP (regulator of RpoE activity)
VETVKDSSAAMNAGIKEGDQILSIDGVDVRDFQHSNTVKIFQTKDKLELTLLPSKFKGSGQVRVTQFNKQCLNYLWSLTMYLQSLEIVLVTTYHISLFVLYCVIILIATSYIRMGCVL